jgi:hypothetical protein
MRKRERTQGLQTLQIRSLGICFSPIEALTPRPLRLVRVCQLLGQKKKALDTPRFFLMHKDFSYAIVLAEMGECHSCPPNDLPQHPELLSPVPSAKANR